MEEFDLNFRNCFYATLYKLHAIGYALKEMLVSNLCTVGERTDIMIIFCIPGSNHLGVLVNERLILLIFIHVNN